MTNNRNDDAYAIEVKGLTKRFDNFVAVDHVSFNVRKGSIFGFLGPNGSGKTTCIKMLCGILQPSAGSATVNGYDVASEPDKIKSTIGYMNQAFSLYRDLTVDENLNFFGGIYGLRGEVLKEKKQKVIDLVGIGHYLNRQSGLLSGGWKQRLALAVALIHEPPLLFLDEPTAGIDPVARRNLWDLLFELAAEGITFLVTTHYMDEAERCDYIAYIYLSKLMIQGTPRELKATPEVSPKGTRRISLACDYPAVALAVLKKMPGVLDATLVESEIHLLIPEGITDQQVLGYAKQESLKVEELRAVEPSLEDVFVTLTRNLELV